MDDLAEGQPLWRFLNRRKLADLIKTRSLRLSRISDLRKDDQRESLLPAVFRETLQRTVDQKSREFVAKLIDMIENQAFRVFASCWFLPGTSKEELSMWRDFAGNKKGGVRINSTLKRLTSSLPNDARRLFGIGRIEYIPAEITYEELFALGPYNSRPFLLKLQNHTHEREIRLYERFARSQPHWDAQEERTPCTRFPIANLIESITISPFCPKQTKDAIRGELLQWGFAADLIA
jgi:hypothetical protein